MLWDARSASSDASDGLEEAEEELGEGREEDSDDEHGLHK
jgi:hypothetical protein